MHMMLRVNMINRCINDFYWDPENSLSYINSTSIRDFSLCLIFFGEGRSRESRRRSSELQISLILHFALVRTSFLNFLLFYTKHYHLNELFSKLLKDLQLPPAFVFHTLSKCWQTFWIKLVNVKRWCIPQWS